ncbi:2-phospho-L-lactate transferase [Archaeoglobales archaeon]|nr:MAG: 2-phospho-L-lactate transferase [Archaeoglobales archaeon]
MIATLSGGTGTPKLLWGLKEICDDFFVVVNTAEDVWVSGNKICPDIDSVIYALSETIDTEKWWGVRNDSFITYERLKFLGFDEGMMIGDVDRATHILRSNLLREGKNLLEATRILKSRFGIKQEIFPMCNEEVSTLIETESGTMHFQEFWVGRRGEPEVNNIIFKGIENAKIPSEVKEFLEECKAVIIGPSNPITSIGPIISVRGYKEILKKKKVIAVSPIIGKNPVSGPAGKFMRALGYEVSPVGVAKVYRDFIDVLVIDEKDSDYELDFVEVVKADTIMKKKEDAENLSRFLLELVG